jgi:hypothetical protein
VKLANPASVGRRLQKKNSLRFELPQEETHKEKNKTNKQTNKTSLEASVAGLMDVRPKHMENLQ